MTWSPLLRVVGIARRSRHNTSLTGAENPAHAAGRGRHPAMAGLDVSPVHGRHCICARCERMTGHGR